MQDLQHQCQLCQYRINYEGICRKCHNRIEKQLTDLYDLWWEAHQELLPGGGGHGSASSEQTIGLNVAALSFIAGDDILNLLHEWEKLVRADLNLTPPALIKKPPRLEMEIAQAIEFVNLHLDWMGQQPWIGDFASELRALHGQAMAAARRFVERVRRIPCPADTSEGIPCGNLLKIREDDLLDVFDCRKCGSEWNSFRLIAVALSTPGAVFWLDAEAIAAWLGVTERRVRQIAKENNIAKRGELYDLKAILETRAQIVV